MLRLKRKSIAAITLNLPVAAFLVSVLAAGSGLRPVNAQARKAAESPAARQVRIVLDRQVEAWNRRDLEAFMSGYWHSEKLSFYSNGTKTAGWQGALERYRQRYQGEGREMGALDFADLQIEVIGPRSVFVRGRFHLKLTSGDASGLFTLIFRKFADGWKIVHDHTGSGS
ncbi:MAG TPA: DUF4440 domain-containing protein [Blastocatellia bacterium]|nr:DUF4440 domain-containing protein [Blastocatellia bacterium]